MFIEHLQKATDYPCKYHILDNASTEQETVMACQSLWLDNKGVFEQTETPMKLSACYNRLLNTVERKYCAFIPMNNILSYAWLQYVMFEHESIKDAGLISVKSQNDNLYLSGLLSMDERIKLCYLQKDNNIGGMLFGKTDTFIDAGGFDCESNIDGLEFEELSHRVMLQGKINFYIQSAKRIEIPVKNSMLFPEITNETRMNYRKKLQNNFKTTQHGTEPELNGV
jgi:hypothetical protein